MPDTIDGMLRARKSFAAVPVDCRKTVFFRRGKAGRTVDRILRLAGRDAEEKSGLVLQLFCRRAALMAGKPFLPERKSGTNCQPDFAACGERHGGEVGTNCQPGVIVRDVKRRKTNTMPSKAVLEGIKQVYRPRQCYCIWPKGFIFSLFQPLLFFFSSAARLASSALVFCSHLRIGSLRLLTILRCCSF